MRRGDTRAAGLLPRLERHPHYAPGWLALADALLAAGQAEAAVTAARRGLGDAAAALPTAALAARGWGVLGRALAATGASDAAAAALERAVALDPDYPEGWFALGSVLQDARQHAAAAEAYGEALRRRPDLHEAALNRGVALGECGRLEEALVAYAAAVRTRPDSLGRVAQALCSGRTGMVVLEPDALRRMLERRTG